MCTPLIGLAMTIGSSVYGAVQQSNVAKQNAAFARYEAAQTKEIGRANEARARDKMTRLIGRQRGQLAARGVRLDSASALDLGDQAATESFMEAQSARFNTKSRVDAKTNEAAIYDYTAKTGLVNGLFGAAANGLSQSLELWPQLAGS